MKKRVFALLGALCLALPAAGLAVSCDECGAEFEAWKKVVVSEAVVDGVVMEEIARVCPKCGARLPGTSWRKKAGQGTSPTNPPPAPTKQPEKPPAPTKAPQTRTKAPTAPPTVRPTATHRPAATAKPKQTKNSKTQRRNTKKYPVFSGTFPSRRLRLAGDPDAQAPIPGDLIWPAEDAASLLEQMLGIGNE